MNRKKVAISSLLGIVVSMAALYLAFANVPLSGLAGYLAAMNYWWLLPVLAVAVMAMALRAVRWRILMQPLAPLSLTQAYHPLAIGFAASCLLPARIGELVRPAILKKELGIPFFGVFAAVAAERLFDIVVLLLLFIAVMSMVEIDPALVVRFQDYELSRDILDTLATGMVRLAVVALLGTALVLHSGTRRLMERAILWSPGLLFFLPLRYREVLRERVAARLVAIMDAMALGLAVARSVPMTLACVALTLLIWLLTGALYWILGFGAPGISLDFTEHVALAVIISFAMALPSAPGFWGLWEAGGMFALALFGVPATEALGFVLVAHLGQIGFTVIAGLVSAWIKGVSLWRVLPEEDAGGESARTIEAPGSWNQQMVREREPES